MNETHVTVVGNLATAVTERRFPDGGVVANFRLATSERRRDRASGAWTDGDGLYVDVTCWRFLAENAAASLVKGDPVVVTGRLYTRNYEHQGQRRSALTLEAHSVGADLSWCTAVVTRTRRRSAGQAGPDGPDGPGDAHRPPVEAASPEMSTEISRPTVDDVPGLVGAAPGGEG